MKKHLTVIFLLVSLISCKQDKWPCLHSKGDFLIKTVDVTGFTKIDLQMKAKVIVRQGTEYSVEVSASENQIEKIMVKKNGEAISIYSKRCLGDNPNITVTVIMPELNSLSVSGEGIIDVPDSFKCTAVDLNVSGSGDILSHIISQTMNSSITGSGSIVVNGSSESLDIAIAGSGDFHGFGCAANSCAVNISGSGSAEVNVFNDLSVDISGSGDVYYLSHPNLQVNISGTGKVIDSN